MPRSLAGRFLFASLLLLPILLGVSAYMLDLAFRRSLLSGEEERLRAHAYLLLGAAEFIEGELWMPEEFQEPRLNRIDSGLYGWISSDENPLVWRSPSARLLQTRLPRTPIVPGNTNFEVAPSNQGSLFSYSHDVVWETQEGEQLLRVSILHDQQTFSAEQNSYRQQLWRWLGLLAVLIVLTQGLILKWGLKPLKALARDLRLIESGAEPQLKGDYPSEIQAVTDNLNQVLNSERSQRERYRHTMDDLAHSLKTPLSLIQGSLQSGSSDSTRTISEQIERMRQIVDHQLKRAVIGNAGIPGKTVHLAPLVGRLVDSLRKVYRVKSIDSEMAIGGDCVFAGDERDLLELLGNLVENAFKYCRGKVLISARQERNQLVIRVEDDGPGIAPEQRHTILERGARVDMATPGQGIGLAVAVDIVSSYRGSLSINTADLGGAAFTVTLPGALPGYFTKT
ncbi:MAG: ATP-binding protein [Cellvibrionaceae bacterium]